MKGSKQSAGILLYRWVNKQPEVFLVHPGGPFWAKKDAGAWGIPKGEFTEEEALAAAKREFLEETGTEVNAKDLIQLTPVKLKSGKTVHAWAAEGDLDAEAIKSDVFDLEWPPRSGKYITVPEVDRGGWFTFETAKVKMNESQAKFIYELASLLPNR